MCSNWSRRGAGTPEHSRRWVHMALAISLFPHFAFAQGTTNPTPTLPVAIAPDAASSPTANPNASNTASHPSEDDQDRFCKDHWLATGACRERKWGGPELMFGGDLGLSTMTETGPFGFNKGVGGVTEAGPAWGVRLGIELFPWLGVEARYVGMYDSAQSSVSPTGSVGFLTTGGEAVVRLTAPTPYVRPYIFGGVAYYDVALIGSSSARAGSALYSSAQAGIPLGFGFDVPLTWYVSVGLEATYHFQLGENYSTATTTKGGASIDGGDLSTFNAVARVRL
jgi:hypothetical protein